MYITFGLKGSYIHNICKHISEYAVYDSGNLGENPTKITKEVHFTNCSIQINTLFMLAWQDIHDRVFTEIMTKQNGIHSVT